MERVIQERLIVRRVRQSGPMSRREIKAVFGGQVAPLDELAVLLMDLVERGELAVRERRESNQDGEVVRVPVYASVEESDQ
jgi:hypothetical protein